MDIVVKNADVFVHKRVGHIAVNYEHFVIVWGGFQGEKSGVGGDYCSTNEVWMYNTFNEVWLRVKCSGEIPPKNSGSTGLVLDNYLYIFGGIEELFEGAQQWYSNNLYRLNLNTMTWCQLKPSGQQPLSSDKSAGWTYNGMLFFFGGFGPRPSSEWGNQYRFVLDTESRDGNRGWNNQLVAYNPQENCWTWPRTYGTPEPRAAHAIDVSPPYVYLFGGRCADVRNNQLYTLNMNTMTWSRNLNRNLEGVIPDGRSWHSFNFIQPDRAVLYGGLNQLGKPCCDWWELRLVGESLEWKDHPMNESLVWHKAVTSPVTGELIMVGGVSQSPYYMDFSDHVSQLSVLQFEPLSLFRLCLKCIEKSMSSGDLPNVCLQLPGILSSVISARLS